MITDETGSFTALISVQTQTSPGVHTVNATDESGNWATATFTVVDMRGPAGNIQELLILVAMPTIVSVLTICLATVTLLKKRS